MPGLTLIIGAVAVGLVAVAAAGFRFPSHGVALAAIAAAVVAAMVIVCVATGATGPIDLPWYSSSGSRFLLALDDLGGPVAIFTASLAAAILWYAQGYLPHHLAEASRSTAEQARFAALMLGFMAAMLLLVLAQDLLLVFVALELTAVASFLLIEFDRDETAARRAAMTALVVTAGSALAFLAGIMLIAADSGTTVLAEVGNDDVSTLAAACLIVGVLSKSAQMPLHFWLPRAMVAPTPVSAYLHSAALVAAGVFVLIRLRPLFDENAAVLAALQWLGLASALLGGWRALTEDELKRVLAYSTIAQYGHVLFLIGAGGDAARIGAPLFIVVHGLCKAPLFMTAGAVTSATGVRRLSDARFSWRAMPALAVVSAVAAAGLAGVPATAGYFKEELFFGAAVENGLVTAVLSVPVAALTVAYMARFWFGLFGGTRTAAERPRLSLVVPIALVVAALVMAGFVPGALESVFVAAARVTATGEPTMDLHYSIEPRAELWLTLGAWAAGIGLWLARRRVAQFAAYVGSYAPRLRPGQSMSRLVTRLSVLSDRLRKLEARDLRERIAAVVLPAGAIVVLGLAAVGQVTAPVGSITWRDAPLVAALAATTLAAVVAGRARRLITMVILLSFAGFSLAVAFSIAEAPEVALVIVVIETLFTLLVVALIARLPPERLEDRPLPTARSHTAWTGIAAGAMAFWVAWFALGARHEGERAAAYAAYTESAHASDTVSAIIADFRGLDTLVEMTVLAVSVMGALAIAQARQR